MNLHIEEYDCISNVMEVYTDMENDRIQRTENDQALFNTIRNYLRGWIDNYTRGGGRLPKQKPRPK